jgi:hypothetical protein
MMQETSSGKGSGFSGKRFLEKPVGYLGGSGQVIIAAATAAIFLAVVVSLLLLVLWRQFFPNRHQLRGCRRGGSVGV